jgi:orotidine-5'-phosphate decarboxylase
MLIHLNRSIIPALDVNLAAAEKIVRETCRSEFVSAYKVGFYLAMKSGLPQVVQTLRKYTDKPIIYDHQKACTDIPDTGELFVSACVDAGIDAAIYFPMTGPVAEEAWIKAAQTKNLPILVGAWMTHSGFEAESGGNFTKEKILDIYSLALKLGITDLVVPGTKIEALHQIVSRVESTQELSHISFYTPGIQTQGGSIPEILQLIPQNIHFIVGRALANSIDIQLTLEKLSTQLTI